METRVQKVLEFKGENEEKKKMVSQRFAMVVSERKVRMKRVFVTKILIMKLRVSERPGKGHLQYTRCSKKK